MNINDINPKKWHDIFGSDFLPKEIYFQLGQLQSNQLKLSCKIEEKNIQFPQKIKTKRNVNTITFSIIFDKIRCIKISPLFSGFGEINIEKTDIIHSVISIENNKSFDIESEHIQLSDIKMAYYDFENQ